MMYSEFVVIEVSLKLNNISSESIFKKLYEIENYCNWWLIPVTVIDLSNRILKFTPIPLVSITWKQTYNHMENQIICEYIEGPLIGHGIWSINSIDKDIISISYKIKVKGRNPFFNILIRTPFFKYKHSKDILKIIRNASFQV